LGREPPYREIQKKEKRKRKKRESELGKRGQRKKRRERPDNNEFTKEKLRIGEEGDRLVMIDAKEDTQLKGKRWTSKNRNLKGGNLRSQRRGGPLRGNASVESCKKTKRKEGKLGKEYLLGCETFQVLFY